MSKTESEPNQVHSAPTWLSLRAQAAPRPPSRQRSVRPARPACVPSAPRLRAQRASPACPACAPRAQRLHAQRLILLSQYNSFVLQYNQPQASLTTLVTIQNLYRDTLPSPAIQPLSIAIHSSVLQPNFSPPSLLLCNTI